MVIRALDGPSGEEAGVTSDDDEDPLTAAQLRRGETVLVIAPGNGEDAFRSAAEVGDRGQVIGLDASPERVEAARRHAAITAVRRTDTGLWSAGIAGRRPDAPAGVLIRPMRASDSADVLRIYQAGLDTGNASFETAAPEWAAFDAGRLPHQRHVAVDTASGAVVGWVAATRVSPRPVYAGVAEHSIYVHPDHQRRGIARALLRALIGSTESAGMWTLQTSIFPENESSVRMHLDAGFEVLGTRRRIGRHHGVWRDVLYLERRSPVVE